MRKAIALLITSILIATGCQPKVLKSAALVSYAHDPQHGLFKEQQAGDLAVSAQYESADVLIAQYNASVDLTPSELAQLQQKYRSAHFVLVSFSKGGHELLDPAQGFSDYSALLQVLSFRMGDYTKLIVASDTLAPTTYVLDRTYRLGNATQVLFTFPRRGSSPNLRLALREFGLGSGNLSFDFRQADVAAIPDLVL